jgi:pimeloyl-ACP methyl ester carboxylesterase
VIWAWIGMEMILGLPLLGALAGLLISAYVRAKYLKHVVRIFQERPLFIIPRGQPRPDAEEVRFPTTDGLMLHGCYLRTQAPQRRGVILFGLEFGSNCWSCLPYCEHLLANGFDVFTFEPRNQGGSDHQTGYEPLQWVTDHEVRDYENALAYLRERGDAEPNGIGLFGISKGGSAGLLAAVHDPSVRCIVTDGIFATYTTMVPYMRKWVTIYSSRKALQRLMPNWVYGLVGRHAMKLTARARGCRFPHLERDIARLAPRPLLMIHGRADTYIKPEMAQALFARAGQPKELWMVEGAKHNQSLHVAGDEYRQRVLDFFRTQLAPLPLQDAELGEEELATLPPGRQLSLIRD